MWLAADEKGGRVVRARGSRERYERVCGSVESCVAIVSVLESFSKAANAPRRHGTGIVKGERGRRSLPSSHHLTLR